MFLLDFLRFILCCGRDDQQQDFYSYRNNRDFSSFNSTNPRSRSSRENRLYCDESSPLLSPAFSTVDSRGKLKLTDVPTSNGDRNRTGVVNFSSPSLSSSVGDSLSSKPSFAPVSSAKNRSSVAGLATSAENIQIEKNSATCSSQVKRHANSQLSKFPTSAICSSPAPAPLSTYKNASGAELSKDHEKLQILTDSATASQLSKVFSSSISSTAADVPFNKPSSSARDSFSPTVQSKGSPSNKPFLASRSSIFSSISVGDSSIAASLSSKPSFAPVSCANNRSSVAGLATGPENIQIKKNSATCSPQVLSTYNNASGAELSIDHKKLQILTDSATASQLSKAPSPSISSSADDVPFNKLSSSAKDSFSPTVQSKGSSSIYSSISVDTARVWQVKSLITPDSTTILTERRSSTSPSLPSVQSKGSPFNKPSLASRSSIHSSISVDPVRVWQVKSLITPDSTTKLAERRSSTSPSLPSIRNDAISSVLQSMPHPVHISTANNSVSWQRKSQTLMEPIRESVQDLPTSSSNATSPSSYRKSGESFRRVLPKYDIPKYLEEMIKNDIVPPVLKQPLSSSNYGDIFATLLYAEDFYIEKWNNYLLKGITLELHSRNSVTNSQKMKMNRKNTTQVERDFVAFIIDSVPEKRPYLLSRDFVFLKPLNEFAEPFKGRVYRVIKSTTLLVEFGEDFHSQHSPSKRYDASFSFNRVCLKRAHHAISVASDPSFNSILFPDQSFSSNSITFHLHDTANHIKDHVKRISNHKGPIPYLVNGQLIKKWPSDQNQSFTEKIIIVAMHSIYRTNPRCRILVCSPTNITSDLLLTSLTKEIHVSSLFRANAAYRDYGLVPDDVIPASLYEEEEECFACPPLAQLLNFSIITCTFMSSFRLYAAGIDSEHFTHIFLVDASLATEPEAIVPLAHLAGRSTAIVVTGCSGTSPSWVRADIARRYGLKKSYFHRLLDREPYKSNDSMFISNLA